MYFSIRKGNSAPTNSDHTSPFPDLNNVPTFTNLPATISQNEDTASGTVLYTLTSFDADAGATLSYTMTVNPPAYAGLFTFATNSEFIISGFCVFVCLFNFFKSHSFKFQNLELF